MMDLMAPSLPNIRSTSPAGQPPQRAPTHSTLAGQKMPRGPILLASCWLGDVGDRARWGRGGAGLQQRHGGARLWLPRKARSSRKIAQGLLPSDDTNDTKDTCVAMG